MASSISFDNEGPLISSPSGMSEFSDSSQNTSQEPDYGRHNTSSPGSFFHHGKNEGMDAMMNDLPDMAGSEPGFPTNTGNSFIATPFLTPQAQAQAQAIFNLLMRGTIPNNIVKYAETFKTMLDSGNHDDLAMIAMLPKEDLAKMVQYVANTLVYLTVEALPIFDPLPTVEPLPTFEPPPTARRDSVDEGTTPRSQIIKRPRPSRKADIVRRGCPGDKWSCKPHKTSVRKYWDSRIGFFNHFGAEHLEDCRVEGNRWQCLACSCPSFGGDGYELMKHIWKNHWE